MSSYEWLSRIIKIVDYKDYKLQRIVDDDKMSLIDIPGDAWSSTVV